MLPGYWGEVLEKPLSLIRVFRGGLRSLPEDRSRSAGAPTKTRSGLSLQTRKATRTYRRRKLGPN